MIAANTALAVLSKFRVKLNACTVQTVQIIYQLHNTNSPNSLTPNVTMCKCQLKDPKLKSVFDYLENNIWPLDSKHGELVKSQASIHNLGPNNASYYPNLSSTWPQSCLTFPIVVPVNVHAKIMKSAHDDLFGGHLGFSKTFNKISQIKMSFFSG